MPSNTTAVVNLAGQNVLDFFHRWTPTFKSLVNGILPGNDYLGIENYNAKNVAILGLR